MGKLYDQLQKDFRLEEGLKACMNCGICTAICPAAEFYNYDPRTICDTVQSHDDNKIEELLKSETIWYCGQCMSCKTRCPRGNTPAMVIMALRRLSQEKGFFTNSEKGRQQLAIKRTVGENILRLGYCVHPETVIPEMHPEQGPVWEWIFTHTPEVIDRFDGNYKKNGPGILRNIPEDSLLELEAIFQVSGGTTLYRHIENYSRRKAKQLNIPFNGKGTSDDSYFMHVYTENSGNHSR